MATKSLGTTFTFTPDGGSAVTVGQLSSISEITCDAELIDVTTLDTPDGFRRFIPGARDGGEVKLTGFHKSSDGGQLALRVACMAGTQGTAAIAFPDGDSVTFPALVKSFALGAAQVDSAIGFTCVLRANGAVTFPA